MGAGAPLAGAGEPGEATGLHATTTPTMCGRYSLADVEREKLGERFLLALEALGAIDPRPWYNVAPSENGRKA